jgi:murein DD-endopeptidase MepM/ murein hydrolase activator NlpD
MQSLVEKIKRGFYAFMGMSVFAAWILFVTYNYIGSPKEWLLKRQEQQYQQKIANLDLKINQLSNRLKLISERDDKVYRVACEMPPVASEDRDVGLGGSDRYQALESYHNSEQIITSYKNLDLLGRELYIQSKSYDIVDKRAKRLRDSIASVPAIQPVSVRDLKYISSKYGFRDHPNVHRWIKHTGIDFAAKTGTPIYATGNGVVEPLREHMSYYGNIVIINHGFGYETYYAHMSKKLVQVGDTVKRGQIIGYVGRSGRVTGSHLHYEVRKNGYPINPSRYYIKDLNAQEYDDMIFVLSSTK